MTRENAHKVKRLLEIYDWLSGEFEIIEIGHPQFDFDFEDVKKIMDRIGVSINTSLAKSINVERQRISAQLKTLGVDEV